MKFIYKGLLPLLIGMALISCAGTDSSAQKKAEDNPNLFKAGTPIADTLATRAPEFAYSVLRKALDSVPGDYYYHVKDGRIDTLFQKEGDIYKTIVSIAYDTLNGQYNYELKNGDEFYHIRDGVLAYSFKGEMISEESGDSEPKKGIFRNYYPNATPKEELHYSDKNKVELVRTYHDNGLVASEQSGEIIRKNGQFSLVKGELKLFYPNGTIHSSYAVTSDTSFTLKEWNESGILTKEIVFPHICNRFWDNGAVKQKAEGLLYRTGDNDVQMDSGHVEIYYENGKINQSSVWKNKQPVTIKEWNENEVLTKELDFPNKYAEYWDNGGKKQFVEGLVYIDNNGTVKPDSGHSEIYSESGKVLERNDWKDRKLIASKQWNEAGILTMDFDFQKFCAVYWDDGKIKQKNEGVLYREDDNGINNCALDSGRSESYFENGKMKEQNDWKDKQLVASKVWNENGTLVIELDFPKYFKEYWDNGKPKEVLTGILYRDYHGGFHLDSGHSEVYFENGKIQQKNDWKDKKGFASKQWNEKGVLIKEIHLPDYMKTYFDNGKIETMATGSLYADNDGVIQVDSGHSEVYFENGKKRVQNDWKNKQAYASKVWNENGVLIKDLEFPKYLKEYWDNGDPKAIGTGILYADSTGKFALDSGHSETYFENGKIQEQNDWKNKLLVTQKEWNENGILIKEIVFPKSYKEYWDNGKPKGVITGFLYRDDQGFFQVDSGHSEVYFESGKIQQKNDWKNKLLVTQKEWNENGILIKEIVFPKSYKEYWDNGKPKGVMTGFLYRDDQGIIQVDSGHSEVYFESGKIQQKNDWKDKKGFASKQWNEKGVLIKELVFPQYVKLYYDNGKIKGEMTELYWSSPNNIESKNGSKKQYYENGQILEHTTYKDKKPYSSKQWYENGNLAYELNFPNYAKVYSEDGNLSIELEGSLYYDDQEQIQIQDGFRKDYYEGQKLSTHKIYKEKKLAKKTEWYANGTVAISVELPNSYKEFYDDGRMKAIATGTIVEENEAFKIKDGIYNEYDQNGEVTYYATYKNFQIISEMK